MGNISIVMGSWGSYNECNERALGSKWLDLSDYTSWEEIEKELIRRLSRKVKRSFRNTVKRKNTSPLEFN